MVKGGTGVEYVPRDAGERLEVELKLVVRGGGEHGGWVVVRPTALYLSKVWAGGP
jgi:hypothetical protein